jgi:ubiquinone/menaquinone biosynthesis C-methylase UbiE
MPTFDNSNIQNYRNSYEISSLNLNPHDHKTNIRINLLLKYSQNKKRILDLCCGTGPYIQYVLTSENKIVGVDGVEKFLTVARKSYVKCENVSFVKADARSFIDVLPEQSFDILYSFCSLYYIPEISAVIKNVSAALAENGVAVLEFGNTKSINGLIARENFKKGINAKLYGESFKIITKLLEDHQLQVKEKVFLQILNDYGTPKRLFYLFPFSGKFLKRFLAKEIAGRTVDERISALPLLRNFSFRYILVCEKHEI